MAIGENNVGDESLFELLHSPYSEDLNNLSYSATQPNSPSSPMVIRQGENTGRLPKQEVDGISSLYQKVKSREGDLASPVRFHGATVDSQPSYKSRQTVPHSHSSSSSGESENEIVNAKPNVKVRPEWLGTSELYMEQSLNLQYEGHLEPIIAFREAVVHDLKVSQYDPHLYLDLSLIDNKLGFSDVALATAYRGMLLVKKALGYTTPVGPLVRDTMALKIPTQSRLIIQDHLRDLQLKLYHAYFHACLGVKIYRDGLYQMKLALKLFPQDPDLLILRELLLQGVRNGQKENAKLDLNGGIYTKQYPWLDKALHIRTPSLIEEVNKNFEAGNCKIRPVMFGPPVFGPNRPPNLLETVRHRDMGPLGIFATQDIKKGDIILADRSLTGISLTPSSTLQYCDTCHAFLAYPYANSNEIIKPTCCRLVAFCSRQCYTTAANGYHKILCGKDINFLYRNLPNGSDSDGNRWRPIMFLRVMAIVLADREADKAAGRESPHVLQHPLLARMTAAYVPPGVYFPAHLTDFQLFENLLAPTKILTLLGIDIWMDSEFQPAVIQTIYWRIENNANRSTYNLEPKKFSAKASCASEGPLRTLYNKASYTGLTDEENAEISEEGAINIIAINPNYLFLNHSCTPNVTWHGSVPNPSADILWLRGMNGEIHKAGSSTIFCTAGRDIKEGEELKISYVGDPMVEGELTDVIEADLTEDEKDLRDQRWAKRKWMQKWFDGGCGCIVCERENEVDAKSKARAEALEAASLGTGYTDGAGVESVREA